MTLAEGRHEELPETLVLVTAFGPFPGQTSNPTELIVDALAGEDHVVSHVLDVSYARAEQQLDDLVRMVDPAAVVSFGVAADATAVRLEEVAHNLDDAPSPDVDGDVRVDRPIDEGAAVVGSRLPLDVIEESLRAAGVPVERSEDPGRYVCNHIFRYALRAPALADRPVGFVHVPDASDAFPPAQVALAGRIVVDAVAAHARGDL